MPEGTLIQPENHWALWAILFAAAAFGVWAEKTNWGSKLSAVVIAILTTFVLSNLGVIPTTAPAYDIVWSYLVPLAIPLLLFKADLRRIIKESGPTLIAFMIGGVGTVIGTVVSYNIVSLGEEGWKMAAIFCSTYIGGSMNYVAASEAVQLHSSDLLTAGIAADNLVMTVYFLVLFALPSIPLLRRIFSTKHDDLAAKVDDDLEPLEKTGEGLSVLNMGKALAIGLVVCAIGFALEGVIGINGSGILIITALVVAAATMAPKQMGAIEGADKIGTLLMQVFFAAIGASANIFVVLEYGAVLFLFAAIILTIHLFFLLTAGRLLKLDLAELVVASNANMGGPTTAAAFAVARKWRVLVIPAILCGTLGYAVATFIGVAVGYWLQ